LRRCTGDLEFSFEQSGFWSADRRRYDPEIFSEISPFWKAESHHQRMLSSEPRGANHRPLQTGGVLLEVYVSYKDHGHRTPAWFSQGLCLHLLERQVSSEANHHSVRMALSTCPMMLAAWQAARGGRHLKAALSPAASLVAPSQPVLGSSTEFDSSPADRRPAYRQTSFEKSVSLSADRHPGHRFCTRHVFAEESASWNADRHPH
jgi:hypothetical protein